MYVCMHAGMFVCMYVGGPVHTYLPAYLPTYLESGPGASGPFLVISVGVREEERDDAVGR